MQLTSMIEDDQEREREIKDIFNQEKRNESRLSRTTTIKTIT